MRPSSARLAWSLTGRLVGSEPAVRSAPNTVAEEERPRGLRSLTAREARRSCANRRHQVSRTTFARGPQRSSITMFRAGDSLKSQARKSRLCQSESGPSHSPSAQRMSGWYRTMTSLSWGSMCSVTKRGLSWSHRGLNHQRVIPVGNGVLLASLRVRADQLLKRGSRVQWRAESSEQDRANAYLLSRNAPSKYSWPIRTRPKAGGSARFKPKSRRTSSKLPEARFWASSRTMRGTARSNSAKAASMRFRL
jgi:hypothetical protein